MAFPDAGFPQHDALRETAIAIGWFYYRPLEDILFAYRLTGHYRFRL